MLRIFIKSQESEPFVDILNRLNTKPDRKMIIKCQFLCRKITSLKVKETLTLRNDCSPWPRSTISHVKCMQKVKLTHRSEL